MIWIALAALPLIAGLAVSAGIAVMARNSHRALDHLARPGDDEQFEDWISDEDYEAEWQAVEAVAEAEEVAREAAGDRDA